MFDGWQKATSLNKSASSNTSSASVHDRRIQESVLRDLPAPICNRAVWVPFQKTVVLGWGPVPLYGAGELNRRQYVLEVISGRNSQLFGAYRARSGSRKG